MLFACFSLAALRCDTVIISRGYIISILYYNKIYSAWQYKCDLFQFFYNYSKSFSIDYGALKANTILAMLNNTLPF